jgi:hypothetical protein
VIPFLFSKKQKVFATSYRVFSSNELTLYQFDALLVIQDEEFDKIFHPERFDPATLNPQGAGDIDQRQKYFRCTVFFKSSSHLPVFTRCIVAHHSPVFFTCTPNSPLAIILYILVSLTILAGIIAHLSPVFSL